MSKEQFKKAFAPKIHPIFEAIPDDFVLQPEAIAEMLGMSPESIRRWCRTGKLPNYNFGNKYIIMGNDFKEFLKRSKTKTYFEKAVANE